MVGVPRSVSRSIAAQEPPITHSRFPCRVCGQPTHGLDTYVVCSDCLARFDMRARERDGDGVRHLPPITGEVEARLRELVDGW